MDQPLADAQGIEPAGNLRADDREQLDQLWRMIGASRSMVERSRTMVAWAHGAIAEIERLRQSGFIGVVLTPCSTKSLSRATSAHRAWAAIKRGGTIAQSKRRRR